MHVHEMMDLREGREGVVQIGWRVILIWRSKLIKKKTKKKESIKVNVLSKYLMVIST